MSRSLLTLWSLAKRTVQKFVADNGAFMAAAISYYVLFSIIPLLVLAVSIFGLVVRDQERQDKLADRVIDFLNLEAGDVILEPNDEAILARYGASALDEITAEVDRTAQRDARSIAASIEDGRPVTLAGRELTSKELSPRSDNIITDTLGGASRVSAALSVVGLAGMAWSASAMFGAVRKSLNMVWDVNIQRPFVPQKLVDLSMVVGLGILLSASVAGTGALRTFRELSDEALGPLSTGTGFFWSVLPFFLPAIVSFVAFLSIYRYVPTVQNTFSSVWPGAVLATILFEVLKNGFAFYIANFNNYDALYGSLGAVLLFMLWTYLTANILLIGAELAVEYPRVMRGDYAGEPGRSFQEQLLRGVKGLFVQHREDDTPAPASRPDLKAKG